MIFDATENVARIATDTEFALLARGADVTFALAADNDDRLILAVRGGLVTVDREPEFEVHLTSESWQRLLTPEPAPRAQHVLAHLSPRGPGVVSGDHLSFAQHLHLVRRAVEVLAGRARIETPQPASLSGIRGQYVRIDVPSWGVCDVYVERAGQGRPVLLLHTAGADGRQFHGLMREQTLLEHSELIAFDLPWHGRSDPAIGSGPLDYALTSQTYADCIERVITALKLDEAPVIVGASMAGAAVIEVAARHPGSVRGAVSCQAGPRVANRHTPWLRHPRVNQALHLPEWTSGLMSPRSPAREREAVWWGYSQGGFGVYERDIAYYTQSWDIDNIAHLLGPHTPPIVLMNGHFDYSVPPEATAELLARLPQATFRDMPELGHFPHAENPGVFATHLTAALNELDAVSTTAR